MNEAIPRRPGGTMAWRALDFIWLCDTSGSMAGARIERLNFAVASALPLMREGALAFPQTKVFIRTIEFDDDARWVVAERTAVEKFSWTPLSADRGLTAMGAAFKLAAAGIESPPLPDRHLPPVIVLVTDGHPTDIPGQATFDEGLHAIAHSRAGRHAQRFAVAVGEGTNLDKLRLFISNPAIPPFEAKTVGDLVSFINWASSAPIHAASVPRTASDTVPHILLPEKSPVQLLTRPQHIGWDEVL